MAKIVGYNGERRNLLQVARQMVNKGWQIGLADGKSFVEEPNWKESDNDILKWDFDGISVIIDKELIVVDIDAPHWSLPGYRVLPPTFKEKSPRGVHLFYHAPSSSIGYTRVKWVPNVDLLTQDQGDDWYDGHYFEGHVLLAPTQGYTRIWPDHPPDRMSLTVAPDWLIEATHSDPFMTPDPEPDRDDSDIPF